MARLELQSELLPGAFCGGQQRLICAHKPCSFLDAAREHLADKTHADADRRSPIHFLIFNERARTGKQEKVSCSSDIQYAPLRCCFWPSPEKKVPRVGRVRIFFFPDARGGKKAPFSLNVCVHKTESHAETCRGIRAWWVAFFSHLSVCAGCGAKRCREAILQCGGSAAVSRRSLLLDEWPLIEDETG